MLLVVCFFNYLTSCDGYMSFYKTAFLFPAVFQDAYQKFIWKNTELKTCVALFCFIWNVSLVMSVSGLKATNFEPNYVSKKLPNSVKNMKVKIIS